MPSASPSSSSSGGSIPEVFQQQQFDDYEHKFKEIDCQLVQLQVEGRKFSNDYDFHTVQLLSRCILNKLIPSRFKIPHMEPYDGSIVSINHLESYKALMMIQRAIDVILCIDFSATLRKAARTWYFRLQSGSISSFEQLEHSFMVHFSINRRMPRISDSLFSIK